MDVDLPNPARMYDYHLGGSHNFAVDREAAELTTAAMPKLTRMMRANRSFLRRAVRFCQSQGITQFVDLGSGIPTVGNVHEVARETDASARVAYVDNDAVAVACSETVLAGDPLVTITHEDLRRPAAVLAAPGVRDLIDFSRPVALLSVAVLHFVPDSDDPAGIMATYRHHLAPGSFQVLSHFSSDHVPQVAAAAEKFHQATSSPGYVRTAAEIEAFFGGLRLVDPGLVDANRWRPDDLDPTECSGNTVGVGRVG